MEVLTAGVWKKQELDLKLNSLKNGAKKVLIKSKAENTAKRYYYAFNKWRKWADENVEGRSLPAKGQEVGWYLAELASTGVSSSVMQAAYYGIRWFHDLCGLRDPTQQKTTKMIIESGKRMNGKPIKKKTPVTPAEMKELFDLFGGNSATLRDLRFLVLAFLSFYGFLRFSEAAKIRRKQIEIKQEFIILNIESSKTDKYSRGGKVYIATTNTSTCPLKILERYFNKANIKERSEEYILRNIVRENNYFALTKKDVHLKYTTGLKEMRSYFSKITVNPSEYGLHSFRSGGASAAAKKGIPDRVLKKHGRWRSEQAKDGYIHEGLSEKLQVSSSISI